MIKVKISDSILEQAKELTNTIPSDIRNSIREGDGIFVGFIGELLVADYLGIDLCNTYDYDLVYKGVKIDVKTKQVTSIPRPNYECSIAAMNTKQKCNMYLFVRVDVAKKDAWLLGWRGKDEYFKMATFRRKGEVDPNSVRSRQHPFPCDCYQLEIGKLRSMEGLIFKQDNVQLSL